MASSPPQLGHGPTARKVGHGLAKVLQINRTYRNPTGGDDKVTRGESAFSVSTADTYVEEEPTTAEWFREVTPSPRDIRRYLYSLFPFIHWIGRYNLQWFIGDLIAGESKRHLNCRFIADKGVRCHGRCCCSTPRHGLRQACGAACPIRAVFILHGCLDLLVLCDIKGHYNWGKESFAFLADMYLTALQPVAVMSTLTGNIVLKAAKSHPHIPGHVVASALAIIAGAIICFIGLVRCGWIVDFIPLSAISAFMTGSALNIAVGQVPGLMGITGFNTRASTYLVVIDLLKHLGRTKLDAAIGLTALTLLYLIRFGCSYGARKLPERRKVFFFLACLRVVFVLCLYVLVSYLVNRHHRKKPKFSILGTVPRGEFSSPCLFRYIN
jgi:solute carrier family 26 (sodium-independent sulfate anion transporter), member 11